MKPKDKPALQRIKRRIIQGLREIGDYAPAIDDIWIEQGHHLHRED